MKFQNMNRLSGVAMLFFTLLPASWAQSVTDSAAQTSSPVQPGAVVEKVERHSEAEKAGLRSGDVLLAWTRGESTGAIESPFDVFWTENEQAPLGLVKLQGLRGAVRHSQCSSVEIELRIENHAIDLTLKDDGKGFDPEQAIQGHGLMSMNRRAKALGASLKISSRAGAGTVISLKVPLARYAALA